VQDVHKHVTSPVDILRAYGKVTIKAHEKTNCATEILFPEAEEWAEKEVNLKGPLAGIPVSLKDSIQVKGFDISVGFSTHTGKPYAADGAMVRLLKDAGAVPFVKTNLPTTLLSFESTNDVWGACKNPHNTDYSPGGSTGGESALLAFGGSRIGIGSDVAGSVRVPAHFSGCYSIRCSTGRWPKMGMNTSMPGQEAIPSVFSPMARTLNDLTYFTKSLIQCKPWNYDYTVHPLAWREDVTQEFADKKVLRVGVMRTDAVVDPSPACARALSLVADALRAEGHDVFDVAPPSPYEALKLASHLLLSDGGQTFMSFFRTGEWNDLGAAVMMRYMRLPRFVKTLHYWWVKYVRRDDIWAGLIKDWHPKSAYEYWQLAGKREAYKARFYDWWDQQNMDVMLVPPNATPAVPHGGMHDAVSSCGYTFLFNLVRPILAPSHSLANTHQLDYSAGVLPVTHVDPAQDALPATFNFKALNGVAQGAYKHYDAAKMAGLPVAVQVVGRRLQEEKVLAIMERCEAALDRHGGRYELLEVE
jgi:Asp-tRNA(Asn)/Glu-tRNA(Gln) amidotransferase A subunit family amidase